MNWIIDAPALIILTLVSFTAVVPGGYMVLSRSAMVPDVLGHSLLPGMVVIVAFGYVVSDPLVLIGAVASAASAMGLVFWLNRVINIDIATAMAVAISGFFALGVIMVDVFLGMNAHLDVEHFLFGSLDLLIWPAIATARNGLDVVHSLPTPIIYQLMIVIPTLMGMMVLQRYVRASVFDPITSQTLGYRTTWISWLMIAWTMIVVLLCLQSLGLALTIAMFVCPALVAKVWCDSLRQFWVVAIMTALVTSWSGYVFVALVAESLTSLSWSVSGTIAILQMSVAVVMILLRSCLQYYKQMRNIYV